MTKEEIQLLYKEKILPINKDPYHFEEDEDANTHIKAYNPMCGDKYFLDLEIENDNVKSVHFHGFGCAISKASTSILLKEIEGKKTDEIREYCTVFLQNLLEEEHNDLHNEELNILTELKNFEGRVDCIKLSWEALLEELNK